MIIGTYAFVDIATMATRGDLVEDLTIGQIQAKYLEGTWANTPLPPGGSGWDEILKMAWKELVRLAKKGEAWAKTVKKEIMKRDNWRNPNL